MKEKNPLQALIDGMSAQWQKDLSESQMTLGKMIAALSTLPPDAEVPNLCKAHSYRGYYDDLAFEHHDGMRPAKDLLAECKAAMGEVFEGYKGGDFVMGALTPVWVAEYGSTGDKLLEITADGIRTGSDD